jgi:MEDS: MEthanogen/methylotroph, DcmR Sensory domain
MSSLEAHLDGEACPHLAVFLQTRDELPRVVADFYALGARRGGWLAHRTLPGNADHERALLAGAGLDVAGLEAQDRMVFVDLDPDAPAEGSAEPWREALDAALARGLTGLWYARFPVGDAAPFEYILAIEREWHRMSRGRPVVTICPFLVGDVDGPETLGRLAETHTAVLVPGAAPGEFDVLRPD